MGWLAACAAAGPFVCSDDPDCVLSGVPGLCHTDGHCVYPNAGCESGFAYPVGVPENGGNCATDVSEPGGTGVASPPDADNDTGGSSGADTQAVDGGSTSNGRGSGETSTADASEGDGETDTSGGVDLCVGFEQLLYAQPSVQPIGAPSSSGPDGFVRAADDFPLDKCSCVTRVVAFGEFADSEFAGDIEVGFYAGGDGPLDPPLAVEAGAAARVEGGLEYTLAQPVVLAPDTYWLSAMPTLAQIDVGSGVWFWDLADSDFGGEWMMQSNLLQRECGPWSSEPRCLGGLGGHDLAFEIYGVPSASCDGG